MLMVLVHVLIQKCFCPEDFVTEATFPLDAAVLMPSRILHTIPVLTPAGCVVLKSCSTCGLSFFTRMCVHQECWVKHDTERWEGSCYSRVSQTVEWALLCQLVVCFCCHW